MGMNWCRPSTRLAVYLRDEVVCLWCQNDFDSDDRKPSLDHLVPVSRGGSNTPCNLFTACLGCNRRRGNLSIPAFAASFPDPQGVERRIRNAVRRRLPRERAIEILNDHLTITGALLALIRSARECEL
ncbi:MAG: hypothetical protein CMN85_10960 [Spongiibacteraceae bacterium]|nr:hypothetical protein [Spongiibacteraceae bacterium]